MRFVGKMRDRDKAILENKEKYTIPDDIKALMNIDFLIVFLEELHKIMGAAIDMFGWTYIFNMESTAGWDVSFKSACNRVNKGEILDYYRTLPIELSDAFDDHLFDMLEENRLILPGYEDDEVARQNKVDKTKVLPCYTCGKYFNKDDMYEEDEVDDSLYTCIKCHYKSIKMRSPRKVKPLSFDRLEALKYHLNITEDEVFLCDSCKRYHLKKFEYSENLCEYCSITNNSKLKSANDYYKSLLEE